MKRQDPRFHKDSRSISQRRRSQVIKSGETGVVAGIGPGVCQVLCGGRLEKRRPLPGLAAGDEVRFDHIAVREVLPRRTTLSRPDPTNPRIERVLAANIDAVVLVAAVASPPLRPGLIDRYLVAIEKGGAEPVLCVNKSDLAKPEDLAPLEGYRAIGVPVVLCSALTGAGLDVLLDVLAGKTCVFTGHSGVGKSSLLNAICPELRITTGAVDAAHQKGRHTTSSSSLYELPNGIRIIDTPGIREFGLWDVGADKLPRYFREFEDLHCGFTDCTHTHEPRCGVKAEVERGRISDERYQGYLRILESLTKGVNRKTTGRSALPVVYCEIRLFPERRRARDSCV
ncbi:MAG: ribosome small subunit-dependent GTPase A [Bryobacteraceae bacterium]